MILVEQQTVDTADTTLTPLTDSSALTAPCTQVTAGGLVQILGELLRSGLPHIHKCKTSLARGAVSAHGVCQRFQGSVSGVSDPADLDRSRNFRMIPNLE